MRGIGLVRVEPARGLAIERRGDEVDLAIGRRREHVDERHRSGAARAARRPRRPRAGRAGPRPWATPRTSGRRSRRRSSPRPDARAPSRSSSAPNSWLLLRASPTRRDDRRAVEHPHRAVAAAQLAVLEERGRRQHDVGELRGVGHHLLVDDDEQVVARELLDHARADRARSRPGCSCRRTRTRSPASRSVASAVASSAHVDRARRCRGRRRSPASALTPQCASLFAIV